MTNINGWTTEEDEILLSIVLNHLQEGSTLTKAYIEVSEELSIRTPEACGFRYNTVLSKQHADKVIEAKRLGLAKKKRAQIERRTASKAERKQEVNLPSVQVEPVEKVEVVDKVPTLDSIMRDIQRISNIDKVEKLQEENKDLKQENITLKEQNELLRAQLDQIGQVFKQVKQIG